MMCVRTPTYSLNINGGMCGFFKGGKGLRQGDPISPLVFVICIEYLSRLFSHITRSHDFKFYQGCKELELCHLFFANDLIIFCKGDYMSIFNLLRGFSTFSNLSGLIANNEKTEVYASNMGEASLQRILNVSGYKKGKLPVKYFGVPITARSLKKVDYDILTEKIILKIKVWGSRHLSYATRVLLVNTVLLSLHTYWSRIFVLPKGVLKSIIEVCRNFLCNGYEWLMDDNPKTTWHEWAWNNF